MCGQYIREAFKKINRPKLGFCPKEGGSDPIPTFQTKNTTIQKGDFVAVWRVFSSPNQTITKNYIKNHQKSHKNQQSPKKWDFFMKK